MKYLKWVSICLGGLIVLFAIVVGILHLIGQNNLNLAPTVTIATVNVPNDQSSLERGQHLATISSCSGCHGSKYEGKAIVDEATIGYIPAPNLTPNGPAADYTDEDWAGAIRQGVAKNGRVLVIMPSFHYAKYGDDDLANLINYFKSLAPAGKKLDQRQIQFPGTIIFGILAFDSWSVNQIDHTSVGGRKAPKMEDTAEYGEYLFNITSCGSCHGENLTGNSPDSDGPQGPNITLGGNLGNWTFEEFALALRAGQTPDKRQLNNEMPWPQYSIMSDVEVGAIWAYIQLVNAREDNQ
jgi:mono/diheme cytochrome c family protein